MSESMTSPDTNNLTDNQGVPLMSKGTEVFGPLAEDYARYRPGYPAEILDVLVNKCGLTTDWVIADIGSGTGNLARVFLETGYNQVFGIEPNREMREAGEYLLAHYSAFCSIDGAAENIPLEDQSVDLITVGQAFHWFDPDLARAEFERILCPDGWVAVLWNDRQSDGSGFGREYAEVVKQCNAIQPPPCTMLKSFSDDLDCIFGQNIPHPMQFPHKQCFDLKGLLGRARSSGHLPQPGEPNYAELAALITDLFNRHQQSGVIEFHYITPLYLGRLENA